MEFVCLSCRRILEIQIALPRSCPSCHAPGHWKAIPNLQTPAWDYELTELDKDLLRDNKILPT